MGRKEEKDRGGGWRGASVQRSWVLKCKKGETNEKECERKTEEVAGRRIKSK